MRRAGRRRSEGSAEFRRSYHARLLRGRGPQRERGGGSRQKVGTSGRPISRLSSRLHPGGRPALEQPALPPAKGVDMTFVLYIKVGSIVSLCSLLCHSAIAICFKSSCNTIVFSYASCELLQNLCCSLFGIFFV
ncbi:hypothetical protein HPP92_019354 [Vanilla planifolia]|uniref:Uncharacterized protein n=1 Tax=Vanilla planifolia TaxID=51239 RepID=A0A835ULL5_VANPL|nr:hypothetical protein HPP92_019354 [Vanilla planifolia]